MKGQESDADVGFEDIWDEFYVGAMVEFEVRKGRWGIIGDGDNFVDLMIAA